MAKYKVLVTARSFGNADGEAWELLRENGCEAKKLTAEDGPILEQLKKELPEADAVIAGLEEYSRELIASSHKLKVISRYGVGCDKVDCAAAKENHVAVTITPGANGDSVADLAVGLMLSCARNIPPMDQSIREGKQIRPAGIEMWGKTLGVIGTGRIGKGVAKRCGGFKMRILGYDPFPSPDFEEECNAEYTDLETIIRESDFITLHVPFTPETKNMFGKKQFQMMKKDAVLVNTARGGIIDETALYEALKAGEIRAAGLDATLEEPPYNSPLCTLANCIITPHAGAATREASSKMSAMAVQNVVDVLTKGKSRFEV